MRITSLSRWAGAVLATGIISVVGAAWLALQELRVNGPIYQEIASGRNLIADVVPPSAYIIEAFLETTTIVKEPWLLEPGRKRLIELRRDFEQRYAFWKTQQLQPALRNQLLSAAYEPARQFWEIVDGAFLPAMQTSATETANDAYLQMTDAYRAHRAAIDEVVKLASLHNTQLERSASDRERSVLATILGLSLGVVALVIVCIIGSISWVVRPISRLQDVMRKLAAGDLDAVIPFTRRRDEIGQMAGAVQVFHDNAVERSRLNREARLLSELNEWLQSCKSLEELYGMVGEFIAKLLPRCSGNLYIYANSRDILENAKGWNGAQATATIHPDDCWGLRRGHTYTFGDKEITFPCTHVGASHEPYCCIPILAHGETIGLLHLRFEQGLAASSPVVTEQRRLALMCAEQISLAIANVKLRDQLRDQSIRDTLTGLFNRRYLVETCRREFSRAGRAGQSVSFLSIDVDHFKKFNDNHGHDAGDTVLRAVGDCLRTSFREDDVACRFGGEEFVVVLPGADSAIAARKAEELRQKVQALVVRYMDGNLPRVTMSIGVASFPQSGTTIEEVLKAADQALYRAKEQGRNTVRVSPEDTSLNVASEPRWPVAAE